MYLARLYSTSDILFVISSFLLYPCGVHPGKHHGLLHGAPLPHAGQQLHKSCPEWRGKESIQYGVDTGIAVGKDMGPDL